MLPVLALLGLGLLPCPAEAGGGSGLPAEEGVVDTGDGGPPFAVLLVNGQTGNDRHVVLVAAGTPLRIEVLSPPAGPATAPFVLYAQVGEPRPETVSELPLGTGSLALPLSIPVSPGRGLFVLANSLGFEEELGVGILGGIGAAPVTVLNRPLGTLDLLSLTLQGIILDRNAPNGRAASTNAVVLKILPASGRFVVFERASGRDVVVLDSTTEEEAIISVGPTTVEREPVIDAQGRFVFFVSDHNDSTAVFRYDVKTGEITRITSGGKRAPQISADGSLLVFEAGNALGFREIRLLNLRTGEERVLLGGEIGYFCPVISPDGNFVACIALDQLDNNIILYDCRQNIATLASPGFSGTDDQPSVSFNGQRTAFRRFDGDRSEVLVWDRATQALIEVTGMTPGVKDSQPAISPTGRHVAFRRRMGSDREIILHDLQSGTGQNISNSPAFDDEDPTFNSDGTSVFFRSERTGNGDIYRYDLATGLLHRVTDNPSSEAAVSVN